MTKLAYGTVNRRRLVFAAGCAVALASAAVRAQSARVHRVAFLSGGSATDAAAFLPSLVDALRELGYREGQNLVLERRYANYSADEAQRLAAALAAGKPALIVATGGGIGPACRVSPPLPVVFLHSGDPIEAGYADSLARPGRNATGVTLLALDLIAKRIDLLRQVQPKLKRLAFLASPEHAGQQRELEASRAAARQFSIEVLYHEARTPAELTGVLPKVAAQRPDAALLFSDALMVGQRKVLADFFLKHQIPSAAGWSGFPEVGHVLSYGPQRQAAWRRLAYYVDRILKGAPPATLPIELPTVMELAINRRTASAMRLTVPPSLLAGADRVFDTSL
jgi:putative ABC transport system substrate-binding protein